MGGQGAGSYYSYDIHGNVATLLNDYRVGLMQQHGLNRFKLMAYNYDLISGKVNEVHYQPGERDELYHRYEYDAENRITDVYTTFKKEFVGQRNLEDHEAFYQYYKHGPLAKSIIGQQQVQGVDYAYTIHGWLKGVNPDGALDGNIIARDAYNFSLHYFNGDYNAINSNTPPLVNASGNVEFKPLYNGNIGAMAVNIKKLNAPLVYNYGYDQLNRLVSMDAFNGWDGASIFAPQITNDYKERISYDGNGNIISYQRNGSSLNGSPLQMDDMQYGYNKVSGRLANNKLRHVKDAIGNANYTEDIDNQPDDNYNYDEIGNLISDVKEGIISIEWSVYGKIQSINKADGTTITYSYDAAGNRISKAVTNAGQTTTTWYVRDAAGNTMGLFTTTGNTLNLSEQHLYGSSRPGIWNRNTDMDAVLPTPINAIGIGNINTTNFDRGNKLFELSNQTGNILLTVSDKKVGVDNNNDGVIDYYEADVIIANDMYSGGMMMPDRRFTAPNNSGYRYGFNGMEKSTEIDPNGSSYTAEFWQYDSRIGRRWNLDPKPNISISSYAAFENNPIWHSDILGDSIAPNRTTGYNVLVIGKTRDFASNLVYNRFKSIQEKNPNNTILIETDNLNESTSNDIIKRLGDNGYINTMGIDYHRSDYDKMGTSGKDKFYSTLSKGYTGDKTCVLLGMCWAGEGAVNNKELPDLTSGISQKLDKATVYGLRTEAASLSFNRTGDFGTYNPAYAFDNSGYGKNERKYQSVWTISKYNPLLKRYTKESVHKTITFSLEGKIIISDINYKMGGGTPRYEHGRIM